MAERLRALLVRCRDSGMTLASKKVHCWEEVSFAGYREKGFTVYADPKKVEAITLYPLPKNIKQLRG